MMMLNRTCILVATVAAACGFAHASQQDQASDARFSRTPHLTVTGQAELERPADQANIRIGVISEGEQVQTAMDENRRKMQAVIDALQKAGLTQQEYQTTGFQVQPVYSRPPRQPPQDWQPRIVSYRIVNTIHVKTQKLELVGRLLQAATDAGANSIDSIWFDLADKRKHRAEAIAAAAANARSDARALAAAGEVRLVRVLSINLDSAAPVPPPYPMMEMRRGGMAADMAAEPPIQPGDITVTAHVTIVYEIASAQ